MCDLIQEIRKAQLRSILCCGIFMAIASGWIIGYSFWKTTTRNLEMLTDDLRLKILQHSGLLKGPVDSAALQAVLTPLAHQRLLRGGAEYEGGFYLPGQPARHGILLGVYPAGSGETGRIADRKLANRGRWSDGYQLQWSPIRHVWTLYCERPVRVAGQVVGVTFARAALTAFFHYLGLLALGLAAAVCGAIWFGGFIRRRMATEIGTNLRRMALSPDPAAEVPLPEEGAWRLVAEENRRIYRELKTVAASQTELLRNCPWGYAVFDRRGRCVTMNDKGAVATGVMQGMGVGRAQDVWGVAAEQPQRLELEQPVTREVEFLTDAGEQRHFLIYAAPTVLEEETRGIMAWFIDTTAQKRREEKIRELAAMVEYSADAIFGFDLNNAVTTWNRGAEIMYGYRAAEIIGRSHQILVPPDLQAHLTGILAMVREERGLAEFETERIRKDYSRIYVSVKISIIRNEKGQITGFSTIHRDITDKRRYEVSLEAEREWLAVTLNSIDAGVIATDKFGRIVFMNKNAAVLTGWPVNEALEQPLLKILYLLDNQTSEAYEGLVAQVLSTDSPVQFQNTVLVSRDLQELPISISCTRIKTAAESFAGIVLVFQDISEKLKTEAELLRAEKLESLGILAGGIAHDFNNFLAAVVANLQLAIIKHDRGMDIAKYLAETVSISQRASELTKQLLTFSKGGAPVKKAASLIELIQDTTRFVLHGSKVKAILEIDPDLLPVEVDEGQISQVIHNLIINANQAMPEGGIIRVRAENIRIEPGGRCRPGSYVRISIHDNGIGIPKEIIHKIFDPYFTTKKEGNGLGLATTYSIIKKHDGYIEVESLENVGTTFRILLPTAPTAAAKQETESLTAASFEGAKILLMDDEEVILKVVGEMMKYFGYKVTLARDGAEAIRYYQQAMETGEPFDAVVMDLTIPGGMGGPEAMAYLREIDPGVRAIVSSGYYNDPIMADYESYGFCGVVRKPYRFEELNQLLSEVVDKKQLQLELEYGDRV